jgi:beta-galactosidase
MLSRRRFVQQTAALAAIVSAKRAALGSVPNPVGNRLRQSLNVGWQFAQGVEVASAAGWQEAELPHCVTKLSWRDWDVETWQKQWIYRKSFAVEAPQGTRVFLHFDGAMQKVAPALNGSPLEEHPGGFLPFEREITNVLRKTNVLTVAVDSRWVNVPPGGSPKGPSSVDYMMPGGITRSVWLERRSEIHLSEVFAKPLDVLANSRRLEVQCSIDATGAQPRRIGVQAELSDGAGLIAREVGEIAAEGRMHHLTLTLAGLNRVTLWSPDTPKLYTLTVRLFDRGRQLDEYSIRTGIREARFEVDGFFLNGKKSRIFGLNRHELYPYVGFAMPSNVMRRDAEILKREFNCNTVRCSHYPQTEAFLDACDELGLMVWEEIPGWGYIGDDAWKAQAIRDAEGMIRRDRNHPSIIVWGTRVNESHNDVELYEKTNAFAQSLDGTRPVSGSMTSLSKKGWIQDVYAYDDYHAESDGSVDMVSPLPDVPFMFSEAVGQFSYGHGGNGFHQYYLRAGNRDIFAEQALYHAQGHDRGIRDPRCAGVITWCAFDYASLVNSENGVKWPGVADVFRIPKFGAAFYQSQVSAAKRVVIEPSFFWDIDAATGNGPGASSYIYSNCDALVIAVQGKNPVHVAPLREEFPRLLYPPFRVDLGALGNGGPELRIDGYVTGKFVGTRRLSADRTRDKLMAQADDTHLGADGDATRVWFRAVDCYGAPAACVDGKVSVTVSGPVALIGDSEFEMSQTGGVGAVWIKRCGHGQIDLTFTHPRLGKSVVTVSDAQVARS